MGTVTKRKKDIDPRAAHK